MRAGGAEFHDWFPPEDGKVVVRLATSFATPEEDVAKLDRIGEETELAELVTRPLAQARGVRRSRTSTGRARQIACSQHARRTRPLRQRRDAKDKRQIRPSRVSVPTWVVEPLLPRIQS